MSLKIVSSCIYCHKSNFQELLDKIGDNYYRSDIIKMIEFRNKKGAAPYEIIKYDVKESKLSLIDSPDFDTALEPTVGDAWIYNFEKGSFTSRKGRDKNPQIYHGKELFVSDDYTGFDIEAAKERRKSYECLLTKEDKRKIGNKDYWVAWCKEHNLEY